MMCEFYNNFILQFANCDTLSNQLGAFGITVSISVGVVYFTIFLLSKYRKGGLFGVPND